MPRDASGKSISIIRKGATVFVTDDERTWQTECASTGEARALIERIQAATGTTSHWMRLTSFRKAPPPTAISETVTRIPAQIHKPVVPVSSVNDPVEEVMPEIGPGLRRNIFG